MRAEFVANAWTANEDERLRDAWARYSGIPVTARAKKIAGEDGIFSAKRTYHSVMSRASKVGLPGVAQAKPRKSRAEVPVKVKPSPISHRPLDDLIMTLDTAHKAQVDANAWGGLIKRALTSVGAVYQDIEQARGDYAHYQARLEEPLYQKWVAEELQRRQDELDQRIRTDMITDRELKGSRR